MNKIIIVLCLVLTCGCSKDSVYKVDCDSGFSTGSMYYATIDDGVIRWEDYNRKWTSRKMLNGEICQVNVTYDE